MKNSNSELSRLKDHITLDFPNLPDRWRRETTVCAWHTTPGRDHVTIPARWIGNTLVIPKDELLYCLIGPDQKVRK